MTEYASEINPWQTIVKDKWVIFDTDAIISITAFKQTDVLEDLQKVAAGFALIHPVQLELLNTNSSTERLSRNKLLADFDFIELPLQNRHFEAATQIQASMPLSSRASPADLYLGSVLIDHHDDRLILTANIKDFPMPIYPRVGHILLQDDHKVKLLTLLSMDKSQVQT